MTVRTLRLIGGTGMGLLACALMFAPAHAIVPQGSLGGLYVKARAAESAGDMRTASAGFAALIADDPTNTLFATRAYRQAISSGDFALALRAAHLLVRQKALTPDARILLALEAIETRDWVQGRLLADAIGKDRVFGFLGPPLRAWIAVGSGAGDPLALIDAGNQIPLAMPYVAEQRALLLIALGRAAEAQASFGGQATFHLPSTVKRPGEGLAYLLIHVASDFAHQNFTPVGLVMARFATYASPDNSTGWLAAADLLRTLQRPDLALAALDHIPSDDPATRVARPLRIALLSDTGKTDHALTIAAMAAEEPEAGATDWSRIGDLNLMMARPAVAATAYGKAIAIADASKAMPDILWPLLLQQANALDLAGDWPGAKRALERAYALAPDQAIILNQFGYSQIDHHENIEAASAMIEKASKLRPDDSAITDSLGWVLYLRGQMAAAVPLLERAAAGDPGEATINEHLGDAYWAMGRLYEARYAWRAALITAEDKDRARLTAKIDVGPSGTIAAR